MPRSVFFKIIALFFILTLAVRGATYYVSESGNDDANGLSQDSAWATIDNGDQKGILLPGDTVNILIGTYIISSKIDLITDGTSSAPVVYQNYNDKAVTLDADGAGMVVIESNGNHVLIKGLEIANTAEQGIDIKGDSTTVRNCYVHDTGKEGYRNEGKYNLFLRNIASNCSDEGFKNEGGGDYAIYHHNIAYSCGKTGFELKSDDSRVINCISVVNLKGINGNIHNICAHNDVWGNTDADYSGGVVDSAGGLSENPRFVNVTMGNFHLLGNSGAVDAGMNLGYPYFGSAPDMGVFEQTPVNRPPALDPIDDQEVDEGQNLNFNVSASDPDGSISALSAKSLPVNSTFSDHGDGTGTFDFNPDFTQAGVYDVLFIASDGELADSEVVEITVNLDPLSYIVINPDSTTISADSTRQFTVTGYSSSDEPRDPGTISWSVIGGIGSINSSGLFDASVVGTGRIVAVSDLGPVDTSAYLEVTPGQLASLEINPDADTISADSTRQFTASGFDADGNSVTELGTISWEVLDGIGTINATGLFDAVEAGYGFVNVTSSLGPATTTDTIFVIPGSPSWIEVLPEENLAVQDLPCQYSLEVYDADNNFISDTTSFATWSTTDPGGSITADALYTAGSSPSPPAYYVIANLGPFCDSGTVTVISDGQLDHVQIEWSGGTPVSDTSFTTDDDSLKFYCRGYDSGNNPLGNIGVEWSLDGTDSIGLLLFNSNYHTTLNLLRPGSGRLIAKYSDIIADTSGTISCVAGIASDIEISPDTATISADSSVSFSIDAFDADGNLAAPVTADSWNVIGDIGAISNTGIFTPTAYGTGYITCISGSMKDTSGAILVTSGSLQYLEIIPDSVEMSLGGSTTFEVVGTDADSNDTEVGNLVWSVIGDIGTIDSAGNFNATTTGTGQIAVISEINNVTDTNRIVTVLPTNLETIIITPDTASLRVTESTQFFASGFDAAYGPISTGTLSWEVIGDIGSIDSDGNFTASAKGVGKIAVTSSINAVTDTTNLIVVEVPTITEIPLGNQYLRPHQSVTPALAFRISNAFDEVKYLEEVKIHNASHGPGTLDQILSNIDSVALYRDLDGNGTLTATDLLVGRTSTIGNETSIAFDPVAIPQGSSRTFFVSLKAALYAHDGDSLDFYMLTDSDLTFSDGTVLAGEDSINSLGSCIIDGMVAEQVRIIETGSRNVSPDDGIERVLTLDIPRNGYQNDTLNILSLFNGGTAGTSDVDSMILFKDDGDALWEGIETETYSGRITFTGRYWSISGINIPLTQQNNRFYICAAIAEFPTDGASFAMGIPKKGIEVASENDGPLDVQVNPVDTITILSSQAVSIKDKEIPAGTVIPGEHSGPLTGFSIVNGANQPLQIDSLRISLYADDPAGAAQSDLNSQIDSVILWLNRDGDYTTISASDSIVDRAAIYNENIIFDLNGLVLPATGGSAGFFVTAVLNADLAKNGNTINFGISDQSDIYTDQSLDMSGTFPVKNPDDFVINAFTSLGISINPVTGKNLIGGQVNQVMLDFALPGDGYSNAILQSLSIVNLGTASSNLALDNVRLWDDTDLNGLTAGDILLGELNYGTGKWTINNLRHNFNRSQNRFIISADIINSDFDGGTLRFAIPVGGVHFLSGTDGPDDMSMANPGSFFLLPLNRITAISIPQTEITVRPGENSCPVLTFALYNGYHDIDHHLKAVRLTNQTGTVSDAEFADHELGQVSLYYDKNGNRSFDDDSLLAVGYFSDGLLTLNGINVGLSPEELAYFFVMADLPVDAIDNDNIAISVESTSDFIFSQTVNLNGDLPLVRGSGVLVDGSVNEQYTVYPTPSRTLSPGDSDICLFAFHPAVNGNLNDYLEEITIENSGDAGISDISSLSIWLDSNGDNVFQETDQYRGDLDYSNGSWIFSGTAIVSSQNSAAIFIVGSISEDAQTGRTIQLSLPLGGCLFASGNDGPLDLPVTSDQIYVISASGLRISLEQLNSEYTVGQDVCVRVSATNLTQDAISNIVCDISLQGDGDVVTLDSGSLGPITIAPGESMDFYRCYTAVSSGEIFWQIQAYSQTQPESTALLVSDTVMIQNIPSNLKIKLVSSIPASVIKGQTHIFPLSLSYGHPDLVDDAAPIRLDSLRIKLDDGNGNARLAGETFSRIVLSSAYTNLAVLEDVPMESSVLLVFSTPDVLYPGEKKILSLMVDIDSSAEVGNFLLYIDGPEDIAFAEFNTGQPITMDPSVQFPLQTASCRIENPSEAMAVSYIPLLGENVNYGQKNVNFMNIVLRHPGEPQSSQIKLTGFSFEFIDSLGESLPLNGILEEIKVFRQNMVIGYLSDFTYGQDSGWLPLNAPPVLSPGEIDTLNIRCSLLEDIYAGDIGLEIKDSSAFVFRDANSGLKLEAISDKDSLSAETIFPMLSGIARLKQPAENLHLCIEPILPSSIVGGADSVSLFELTFNYPVADQYSPIRLSSLQVSVIDTLEKALDPSLIFQRIGYVPADEQAIYQSSLGLNEGRAEFDFGDDGLVLYPGDDVSLSLIADLESDIPYDHFKIVVQNWNYFDTYDATDTTHDPGYSLSGSCSGPFPYESGIANVFLPAGRPIISINALPTQSGYPGNDAVALLSADIRYQSESYVGSLELRNLYGEILQRTEDGFDNISAENPFDRISLYINDDLVAQDTIMLNGNVNLEIDPGFTIARDNMYALQLVGVVSDLAIPGNYVLRFGDSTFLDLADKNLGSVIYAGIENATYPFLGSELSLSEASLEKSFTNYPNPFNPDLEGFTRIGFIIDQDAYIDIEIYTITGKSVNEVAQNSRRNAGAYTIDRWYGVDDLGLTVIPGTYFCRITAHYDSGKTESFRRKIAVIR